MKRILFSVCMIALSAIAVTAQRSVQDRVFKDAFLADLPTMIEIFNHEKPCHMYAYWYDMLDVDGDDTMELVLADFGKEYYSIFKYKDGDVREIPTQPLGEVNWKTVFWLANDLNAENDGDTFDMTLKHRPVFAHDINIEANKFSASSEVWGYLNPTSFNSYDRMIFKPHIGTVKLARKKETGQGVTLTWALTDPALTKKMFRGYASTQAVPVVVPHAFLETHTPLQFSRWLNGEKIVRATTDAKKIISDFYGGRRIHEARWVASCEVNERSFYDVVFEPQDGYVLYAFVCLAEGEVVSVKNEWIAMADDSMTEIDTGESLDDIFFHGPQIMAMVACEQGLELYVRWNSMEGMHFAIWREYYNEWITIQDDYEYLVAY